MLDLSLDYDVSSTINVFHDSDSTDADFTEFLESLSEHAVFSRTTARAPSEEGIPLRCKTPAPGLHAGTDAAETGFQVSVSDRRCGNSPAAPENCVSPGSLPTRAEASKARVRAKNRRNQKAYRERLKVSFGTVTVCCP